MAWIIACECGTVVRGREEQELVRAAREHMQTNHPVIALEISDEQLLALGHEESSAPAISS